MEPQTNTDPIGVNTWKDKLGNQEQLVNYSVGVAPIAKPLQSSNFKKGTAGWRLNTNGEVQIKGKIPASAAAAGTAGTIAISTTHIYVCTATNTWKRVAIATW